MINEYKDFLFLLLYDKMNEHVIAVQISQAILQITMGYFTDIFLGWPNRHAFFARLSFVILCTYLLNLCSEIVQDEELAQLQSFS